MVCYVVAELEKNELFGKSHNCTCKKIRVTIFARPVDDFKWPVVKDKHNQKRQGFM